MLLTGNQYRDSIRDGREVWVDGKRVEEYIPRKNN